ncbi:MAG: beta-lactamase family protein, partial [candidate division Zixibacteria bacterium]|nr:beta-lactamase family protein [candidate division Zixibacteria bacterium]
MKKWSAWLLLCWSAAVYAQGDPVDKNMKTLGEVFDTRMKELSVVGGAVAIVHDGKTVYTRHYGYADEERKIVAGDESIYLWGSNTKLFTTLAIMQLRDHGRLTLDDPLVHYIPSFRNVNNPFANTKTITLRMLMSHSSGLQNG